jgi:hypothetical protein
MCTKTDLQWNLNLYPEHRSYFVNICRVFQSDRLGLIVVLTL